MAAKILVLRCITNLHVGNGDVNYNIIDNEVEKDPVTGYPTIHSSGVKGAFREYFENGTGKKEYGKNVNDWFGSDASEKSQGKIKILAGEMVARPLRATAGDAAFYDVTTKSTVLRINELSKTFINRDLFAEETNSNIKNASVEGISLNLTVKFGSNKEEVYLIEDKEMRENVPLPVVARNKLENGISKNLWYEEIVPHGSVFVVPIVCDDDNMLSSFINAVDGKIIQFGGNASIGYGLCKISVEG